MSVVVELLGLPGAGKSTLANALARELAARGRTMTVATQSVAAGTPAARRFGAKLGLVTRELVGRRGASVLAIRAVAASQQAGPSAALHRMVAWLVGQRLVGAARDGAVDAVVDEGGLQALWSVGLAGDHRGLLDAWRARPERWSVGDVVVVLVPPTATIGARLAGRADPHSRIERLDGVRRHEALARGEAVLRDIVDALPDLGVPEAAVVTVPEAAWGDEVVRTLADRLEASSG